MDEIIARIKANAKKRYPDVADDSELLDFVVNEVVDRALIYMGRDQLVRQYEEDIVDYPITDKTDTTETYYDFWKHYEGVPIPERLERTLSSVVVGAYRTVTQRNTDDQNAVKSLEDNGQKIVFADQMQHYFDSGDDSEIFSGSKTILDRYKLGKVIGNSNKVHKSYWR